MISLCCLAAVLIRLYDSERILFLLVFDCSFLIVLLSKPRKLLVLVPNPSQIDIALFLQIHVPRLEVGQGIVVGALSLC